MFLLVPGDTSDLILMVSLTFAMRRHLIRVASAPFTSFRLTKFRRVPLADLRARSLAMKYECWIYVGSVNLRSNFKLFVDQSSRQFETTYESSCSFQRTCPIMYVVFHSEDISRWSCRCREVAKSSKRWFLDPRFVGEGIPHISDIHFQIALTSEHVVGFGWVPFSELGGSWRKKAEDERRKIGVKHKSANNYHHHHHHIRLLKVIIRKQTKGSLTIMMQSAV